MSEPQTTKKKNKKKKKNGNGQQIIQEQPETIGSKKADVLKSESSIKKVLPQNVGITTTFKDVEVTMTTNGNTVNGVAKKKKKKKKSKQQAKVETEEPTEETENENLLHFSENHIELVNHPEISVTISKAPVVIPEEPTSKPEKKVEQSSGDKKMTGKNSKTSDDKKTTEKNNKISDDKKTTGKNSKMSDDKIIEKSKVSEASESVNPEASESVKKKKKKKKKKKNSESAALEPTGSATEPADDGPSAPTYIKLPADGGNCVLLVSHENFSNGSKQASNSTSQENPSKSATVLLKKKEDTNIIGNPHQDKPAIQNSSSVSIFPVYSNADKGKENKPEFNVTSSLGKISDLIKNEDENLSKTSEADPNKADEAEENSKSKAQLKAERRAKQEAQRAAKLAKNVEKDPTKNLAKNSPVHSTESVQKSTKAKEQTISKPNSISNEISLVQDVSKISAEQETYRKVQIFSHLPQYKNSLLLNFTDTKLKIPSPVLELGSHYKKGTICGSNARCVGFLAALRQIIIDYKIPQNKSFWKDLDSKLQGYVDFLGSCRPLSVSIVNATKFLKHQINHIPEDTSEEKAKDILCQSINDFVREEILLAKEAITMSAAAKIVDNDTILVFAYSSLVKDVLCKAHDQNKSFRVIVVDSRPKLEGLEMLRQLVRHGLQCCYISINAVSLVVKKVNKVMIGAHALLANGYVMSRLGCKILSLVSSVNSVPVLVCCETYKFWERSLTDSIVHNELGNPDDLINISLNKKECLLKWHDISSLHIYNLLYDVTPSELISVVITEKGLIPCTSVPVLLRVKHAGKQE